MFDLLRLGGVARLNKSLLDLLELRSLALKPEVTTSKTASGYLPAALNIECLLSIVKVFAKKRKETFKLKKKKNTHEEGAAGCLNAGRF